MDKPRINTEWSKTDHTWLKAQKAKFEDATWPQFFKKAAESRDLLDRIRSTVGSGKLVIERMDGTRTEVMI